MGLFERATRSFNTREDNKWPGKPPETDKPSANLLKKLGQVARVFTNYFKINQKK